MPLSPLRRPAAARDDDLARLPECPEIESRAKEPPAALSDRTTDVRFAWFPTEAAFAARFAVPEEAFEFGGGSEESMDVGGPGDLLLKIRRLRPRYCLAISFASGWLP